MRDGGTKSWRLGEGGASQSGCGINSILWGEGADDVVWEPNRSPSPKMHCGDDVYLSTSIALDKQTSGLQCKARIASFLLCTASPEKTPSVIKSLRSHGLAHKAARPSKLPPHGPRVLALWGNELASHGLAPVYRTHTQAVRNRCRRPEE